MGDRDVRRIDGFGSGHDIRAAFSWAAWRLGASVASAAAMIFGRRFRGRHGGWDGDGIESHENTPAKSWIHRKQNA